MNGGDRIKTNIPENYLSIYGNTISYEYGVGGTTKRNSSSKLLNDWQNKSKKEQSIYKSAYKL